MTRYLILTAALFVAMLPVSALFYWFVYDVLPTPVATHLGVGMFCLSVGFLLGQRHGIQR